MQRFRRDEEGSVLVTALLLMLVMIPFGLAILDIVDRQASASQRDRQRDATFNLAEGTVSSLGLQLYANWPRSVNESPSGQPGACSARAVSFTLGTTSANPTAARLATVLLPSFTSSDVTGSTVTVTLCDDDGTTSTTWSSALLNNASYDVNKNGALWAWVRVRTPAGRERTVAGKIDATKRGALPTNYGLVSGRFDVGIGDAVNQLTSSQALALVNQLTSGGHKVIAPDPSTANTDRIGIRCGVLQGCLGGLMAGLGETALNGTVVGSQTYQYGSNTTATPQSIAQFRSQAKSSGTYDDLVTGGSSPATAPACEIPSGAGSDTVVFLEQVGTGDQWCSINTNSEVGSATAAPKWRMLVIGSGRVVLKANGTNAVYGSDAKRLKTVVYALNLQTASTDTTVKEIVRLQDGATVRGALLADGKYAKIGVYPTQQNPLASLVCTPAVPLLGIPAICPIDTLLSTLNGLLSTYGPAVITDVTTLKSNEVYDASSLVPGSFVDLSTGDI